MSIRPPFRRRSYSRIALFPLALLLLSPGLGAQASTSGTTLDRAEGRIQAGDLAGALALLEPGLRAGTASASERGLIGRLYLQLGRPGEALALLEPLAALESADPVLLFETAQAALALGRLQAAERYLERSAGAAPFSQAAILLAAIRSDQGSHAEAARLLRPLVEQAAAVAERDSGLAAEISRRYARELLELGDQQAAVSPLELATRLEPSHRETWQLLGDTLIALDRVEEAYVAFARAQQLDERQRAEQLEAASAASEPDSSVPELIARAHDYQRSGEVEEALRTLRQAMLAAPRDPRPRVLEIRLLISEHREEEALPKAATLIAIAPEHPEGYYLRGMARLVMQDLDAAEADLRRVLELSPAHLAGLNGLAILLISRNDNEAAEKVLLRLLERWPADELARRNLDKVRRRLADG